VFSEDASDVSARVDDIQKGVHAQDNRTFIVPLSGIDEGRHSITVSARKMGVEDGNDGMWTNEFIVDASAPEITITYPQATNNETVTLTIDAADNDEFSEVLSRINVTGDVIPGTIYFEDEPYTAEITLQGEDGNKTVYIRTYNIVDHSTLQAMTIELDQTGPVANITVEDSEVVEDEENAVLTRNPSPEITAEFNETVNGMEAFLVFIMELGEEITPEELLIRLIENATNINLTTSTEDNRTFTITPDEPLEEAVYSIVIMANDSLDNQGISLMTLVVQFVEVNMSLIEPSYGVSPAPNMTVRVRSDRNATCGYNAEAYEEFIRYWDFDISGGTDHVKHDYGLGSPNEDFEFYVMCIDEYNRTTRRHQFMLRWDPSPPEIQVAINHTNGATPPTIITQPLSTYLIVTSNDDVRCKYSAEEMLNYSQMALFNNFNQEVFNTTNVQRIPQGGEFNDFSNHTYYVLCENQAGNISNPAAIFFYVNTSIPGSITINSPRGETSNRTVTYDVFTNRPSKCCATNNSEANTHSQCTRLQPYWFELNPVQEHIRTPQIQFPDGRHTHYVTCQFGEGGRAYSVRASTAFTIDATPPVMDRNDVDDGTVAWRRDRLRLDWNATEDHTRVTQCNYSIGNSTVLRNNVVPWTTDGCDAECSDGNCTGQISATGLNLTNNARYYWALKVANSVDLWSSVVNSDGVLVDTSQQPDRNGTCSDGIRNTHHGQAEGGVDCGGPCVRKCELNSTCNENNDCITGYCNPDTDKCDYNLCNNTMFDAPNNETDMDCGGNVCGKCENGKDCGIDSDCISGFFNSRRDVCVTPTCNDGFKNQDETDADCGGSCEGCGTDQLCRNDTDCASGYCSMNNACRPENERDTDGDGIPDAWEIEHGLDPNENDAEEDQDQDTLSNYEEYMQNTDPAKKDTDGDGIPDDVELAEGFDPLDADDYPRSHAWTIILLIIAILVVIGGGGYYGYKEYIKRADIIKRRTRVTPPMFRPSAPTARRRPPITPKKQAMPPPLSPAQVKLQQKQKEKLIRIEEEKEKQMGKMFRPFERKKEDGGIRKLPLRTKKKALSKLKDRKTGKQGEEKEEWIPVGELKPKKGKAGKKEKTESPFEKLSKIVKK